MKKKYVAILLVMVLSVSLFTVNSFAETAKYQIEGGTYEKIRNTETVNIDNKLYQYSYYSNPLTNDRAIEVRNISDEVTDYVTIINNIVYLNGDAIGSIEEGDDSFGSDSRSLKAAGSWKKLGSNSKRITWAKGTANAIVAAIIAGALSYAATASTVIAATGVAVIGVLASQTTGGTVSYTVYSRKAGKLTNYKWSWKFKASTGDKYGPYTSYTSV